MDLRGKKKRGPGKKDGENKIRDHENLKRNASLAKRGKKNWEKGGKTPTVLKMKVGKKKKRNPEGRRGSRKDRRTIKKK